MFIATHLLKRGADRCPAWQPGDDDTRELGAVTCGLCRALNGLGNGAANHARSSSAAAPSSAPAPDFDNPRAVMAALVDRLTPAAELELERRRAAALELVRTDANYEAFLGATYEAVSDGN